MAVAADVFGTEIRRCPPLGLWIDVVGVGGGFERYGGMGFCF